MSQISEACVPLHLPYESLAENGELKDQAGSGLRTQACLFPHLTAIHPEAVNAAVTRSPRVVGPATWSPEGAVVGEAFFHELVQLCPGLSDAAFGPQLTGHSGAKMCADAGQT